MTEVDNITVQPVPRHLLVTCHRCNTDIYGTVRFDRVRLTECGAAHCGAEFCPHCVKSGAAFKCPSCDRIVCPKHKRTVGEEVCCEMCLPDVLERALDETKEALAAAKATLATHRAALERVRDMTIEDLPNPYAKSVYVAWALVASLRAIARTELAATQEAVQA